MNKRTLMSIRKWVSLIGILTMLSGLIVIPTVQAYTGADAPSWASDAVDEACDNGLIDCDLATPGFTAIVNRAVGYQMLSSGFQVLADTARSPFTDVSGQWYAAAAHTAYTLGWTAGSPAGSGLFAGSQPFTRAQMAVAAARVLGLADGPASALTPYTDRASIPAWATGAVAALVNARLMGQGGNTTLRPNDGVSKVEAIVMLNSSVTYADDEEIDVLEVAADRMDVEVDVVSDALDLGQNIVDGELVAVEGGEEEETTGTTTTGTTTGTTTTGTTTGTTTTATGGTITVALSSTPAGTTLPLGARAVPMLQFSLTSSAATVVDSIKFSRSGVGVAGDFAAVYVYEGVSRLKAGKTISTDTNTVEFTSLNLTVEPATPRILTLKGDIAAAATPSDQHIFSIVAGNMGTNGTVAGLPVAGSQFSIGSVAVSAVTIAVVTAISGPSLGATNAECGNFKLTAGANDIQLNSITLTHGGTISRSNMGTFKLAQPGYTGTGTTDGVIAETAAINSSDRLVFTLGTPFAITKNQNRNFEVRCDILGGRTTDTLKFYLDETGDLQVTDKQYGFGGNVTNQLATGNVTAVALQGGRVTFADNGPVAQNVSTNTTSKQLFNFSVTGARNVTVRDFWLLLEQTAWDGLTALKGGGTTTTDVASGSITTAGVVTVVTDTVEDKLVANDVIAITTAGVTYYASVTSYTVATKTIAGTLIYPSTTLTAAVAAMAATDNYVEIFDAHLRTRVKNIKLVDLGTGGTITSTTNSNYAMAFSDDFDITAGQTRRLSVQADLDSSLVAVNAFKAGIDFNDANTIRDNDANEYVATSDVVAGAIFGKTMTAVASSLTVSIASTPVSETVVKGTNNVDALGLSMRAGDGGSVRISRVDIRLKAATSATLAAGWVGANTVVTSVGLYKVEGSTYTQIGSDVGMSLVGDTSLISGYYKAQFNSLSQTIAAASTQRWVVRVNLANTISTNTYLAVGLDPDNPDIVVQDQDGNTLVPTGNDMNNIALGTTPTVIKTVTTSGSLAVTELGSPNAGIVVAGTVDNLIAKHQFSALNEAFKVSKLDIQLPGADTLFTTAAATTYAGAITKVKLRYTNSTGVSETKEAVLSGGVARFTGLDLLVGRDSTATMEVLADMNSISGGARTGDQIRLGISNVAGYTFEAVGQGSSETVTAITPSNQANINTQVLRKAMPVVTKCSTTTTPACTLPTNFQSGLIKIYGFNVKAEGGAVSLKRIRFTLNASLDAGDQIHSFSFYRSSSNITSNVSINSKYGTSTKDATDITGANTTVADVITVTFDDDATGTSSTREETIASGITQQYFLEANITGASTGNNLTVNIADDSVAMVANAGVQNFIAKNSVATQNIVFRYDTVTAGTSGDDFVYADLNGDGDYTAAADYAWSAGSTAVAYVEDTITNAPELFGADAFIPGRLMLGTSTNDARLYFDINNDGTSTYGTDILVGTSAQIVVPTTTPNAAETAITWQTLAAESTACTGMYIDMNTNGSYAVATDYCVKMTQTTTALTEDTELATTNMNFIWSDQGVFGSTHSVTTTDWANGLNVDNLATSPLSLSY